VTLLSSVFFESSILALIGLGLTFWGALLTYVKSNNYVKAVLLDSTAAPSLKAVDEMLNELGIEGKAVYLPPENIEKSEEGEVFISKKKDVVIIPRKGEVSTDGIYITSPGVGLANLYERRLGKKFIEADLEYLRESFPRLFIEDLEIAEDLEMNLEDNRVKVRIEGNLYSNLCMEVRKLRKICDSIGCPLCGSLAVALARVSGKPVVIEDERFSKNGRTLEVEYRILEV